jgi:hypothetical protein
MAKKVLSERFMEPLNGATSAKVDIHAGDGNLRIDRLNGEQALASGTLQYQENQETPRRTLVSSSDQVSLSMQGRRAEQRWIHFPWSACNGATEWQIHLNPTVRTEIKAQSDGGNLTLNLTGMTVTHISADTGGGNVEVVLPENAANLSISARTGGGNVTVELNRGITGSSLVEASSGAGNVVVRIPDGTAARVHTSTGLGKTIIDPRLSKCGSSLYQSPDFEQAADKVEITMKSGAGNVIVETR